MSSVSYKFKKVWVEQPIRVVAEKLSKLT